MTTTPVDVMLDAEFAQWLRETHPTTWRDIGFLRLRHLVKSYDAFIIAGNEARKGGAGWFPLSLDEFVQVWVQKESVIHKVVVVLQ